MPDAPGPVGGAARGAVRAPGLAPGCPGSQFTGAAVLDGAAAILTEFRRCGPAARRFALVRVDLATGDRRTVARLPSVRGLRAAGEWIAWSRLSGSVEEIVLWRDGRVRRRIREVDLGAIGFYAWDLQADGTIAFYASPRAGRRLPLYVVRPAGRARRIALAPRGVDPFRLHLARDRLATFRYGHGLGVGRSGVWQRVKVLDSGRPCPFVWPLDDDGEPCVPRQGRDRRWIVRDRIAR